MISFNLKSSLAIALICFVLGCCTALLLIGSCNNNNREPNFIQPDLLKKQADSIEDNYGTKITELETRNRLLHEELNTTKAELNAVKTKAKSKAATIKKLIEREGYPAKELLKKIDPSTVAIDSSLSLCDSLAQEVSEYIHLNETKDSLYEVQIGTQDNIISGKDSVIAFKTEEHNALNGLFNQSLKEQVRLLSENKQLQKRIKRQKLKGKLLALGTAILSGLATHYVTQ